MKKITFLNQKANARKTHLIYGLTWMYAELGVRVLAVDLDPQSHLSVKLARDPRVHIAAQLTPEAEIEQLWLEGKTIFKAIEPVLENTGELGNVHIEKVHDNIDLLVGSLTLSSIESRLRDSEYRLRLTSVLHTVIQQAAQECETEIILIDTASNLGLLNCAVYALSDYIVVPLIGDDFIASGLKDLGGTLAYWRSELALDDEQAKPLGYIISQLPARLDRAGKPYLQQVKEGYAKHILRQVGVDPDPYNLGRLKNYPSLGYLADEARKPMFLLKPADGVGGSELAAIHDLYFEYKKLAANILKRSKIDLTNNTYATTLLESLYV